MKKPTTLRTFVTVAVLVVVTSSITLGQARKYKPKVGEAHPAFVLPNIESGKAVSLDDYRGKKVLLFHFASW